ncbi:sugar kinase [Janthinobacterium psychrotolerans]|uniref:2-dehydro-3-deoxygluconokinase n=1 Tax=Janthinobacterium psychrotolerans TaxID=1747903 RepID=A0A1A7BZ57_9BURK|nr:sugar kinase [Janthinobacterium psychrotolerans]OBV37373.1 2-dehydro-3-deoxygluconokinase [Janthinobacterium psychrotolerans]
METNNSAGTVFVIGECMIELQRGQRGATAQAMDYRFGGDTLNAAVYLARLVDASRHRIAYVTALGTDGLSDDMAASWQAEGIDTACVQRLADKLPGMYLIETDADGERRFHYWRSDSAARHWLRGPQAPAILAQLAQAPYVYLSGISLAILSPADRDLLLATLAQCRANGGQIVFDNNYRPRLWEGAQVAAGVYHRVLQLSSLALLTLDDEEALHGAASVEQVIARTSALGVAEIVLKRGGQPCIVWRDGQLREVAAPPVARVVDTTAAGDSFGAAYFAARLAGQNPADAALAGHRLAGCVIGQRGAIIARALMPR